MLKETCYKPIVFSKIWSLTLHFLDINESLMLKEYFCKVSEMFLNLQK